MECGCLSVVQVVQQKDVQQKDEIDPFSGSCSICPWFLARKRFLAYFSHVMVLLADQITDDPIRYLIGFWSRTFKYEDFIFLPCVGYTMYIIHASMNVHLK